MRVLLLFCGTALMLIGAEGPVREYRSTAALAEDLRKLSQALEKDKHLSLPSEWRVETKQGSYAISTVPLKQLLESGGNAETWLDHLVDQVEGFDIAPAGRGGARAELGRILAQREFAGDRPPNALELLWRRIRRAIYDWLESIFHFENGSPAGNILFFSVAFGLALTILSLVFRRERGNYLLGLKSRAFTVPVRNWEQWLVHARAAADHADYRRAIQCAYWAGICRLQETGELPKDMARTPREYLRHLSPGSSLANALRGLTVKLETFWYGPGQATAVDLSACFAALKDIGCQVP